MDVGPLGEGTGLGEDQPEDDERWALAGADVARAVIPSRPCTLRTRRERHRQARAAPVRSLALSTSTVPARTSPIPATAAAVQR